MITDQRFVTQAEFARLRGVSRKTITKWKACGYLVMDHRGLLVDIVASAIELAKRPAINRAAAARAAHAAANGNNAERPRLSDEAIEMAATLREAAHLIDEAMPAFANGALKLSRVFALAGTIGASGIGHSREIAAVLQKIEGELSAPAAGVAEGLRAVADKVAAGAVQVSEREH